MAGKNIIKLEDRGKHVPFNRLPEAVKQKVKNKEREQEKECLAYHLKLRRRHCRLTITGVLLYLVPGSIGFSPEGTATGLVVMALLSFSGGLGGYLISKKELGSLWGVVVFGCPIIVLTLANAAIHYVSWIPIVVFFAWVLLLALGAFLGYYVENSD